MPDNQFRKRPLRGQKTSISPEEPFWKVLKDIAASRRVTTSELVAGIGVESKASNLSSAVRVFVLDQYYQTPPSHSPVQAAFAWF